MTARFRLLAATALGTLVLGAPTTGRAQQPVTCATTASPVAGFLNDACTQAADIFAFVMPQFGQALAGGGAVLGTANTLGGLGKFSFNVRVNAVQGRVPTVDDLRIRATGPVPAQAITTEEVPVPAPVVDVGVGLFNGIGIGRTRFLSLDGLVNVAYLPETDLEDFAFSTPSGRLALGFGGRLGLTRDAHLLPAISVSFIRRELPTADVRASFQGNGGGQDSISLTGLKVRTDAIRLSISKKFGFLELGGGAGRNRYDSRVVAGVRVDEVAGVASARIDRAQLIEQDVVYGSVAINFPLFKLAVEAGQASGGEIRTFNTFVDGGQNDARLFASAGLRISF
jgi:hypothetical protein